MFVLELTYTASPAEVDAVLPDHVSWLEEHYAQGIFLASGRKNPRTGGIIIAAAEGRARIDAVVAGDPFLAAGVCTYKVTEFFATKTAPELEPYRQPAA